MQEKPISSPGAVHERERERETCHVVRPPLALSALSSAVAAILICNALFVNRARAPPRVASREFVISMALASVALIKRASAAKKWAEGREISQENRKLNVISRFIRRKITVK